MCRDTLCPRCPPCLLCVHRTEAWRCAAFPAGIPDDILAGVHDHLRPYPGDGGILYERRPVIPTAAAPTHRRADPAWRERMLRILTEIVAPEGRRDAATLRHAR
jgi:hypothetical protein